MEIQAIETAAQSMNSGHPGTAYAILNKCKASVLPEIRKALLAAAFSAAQAKVPAELAGGSDDECRERAFARFPGTYLPGAEHAEVSIHPRGICFIVADGKLCPWTYGSRMYVGSDADDLADYMEESGYPRGYLVGEPGVARGIKLRPGVQFVSVDLGRSIV